MIRSVLSETVVLKGIIPGLGVILLTMAQNLQI